MENQNIHICWENTKSFQYDSNMFQHGTAIIEEWKIIEQEVPKVWQCIQ